MCWLGLRLRLKLLFSMSSPAPAPFPSPAPAPSTLKRIHSTILKMLAARIDSFFLLQTNQKKNLFMINKSYNSLFVFLLILSSLF